MTEPTRRRITLLLPLLAVAALVVLAVWGRSAVMATSAIAAGLALWSTRAAPARTRALAAVVGALGGSLFAEAVHTAYHLLGGETASGDSGFFFVSAALVGGINAVALLAAVWAGHLVGARRPVPVGG